MNRRADVENTPPTMGAAAGSRPRRATGRAPKHRPWPSGARATGTRALWCAAMLLALCTPAMAMETLHIGFVTKIGTDGRTVETADDASLAEGRLLAELLPFTNPTFAIGEQLSLVLALETASGDVSPFTLNVREPTGARRPLSREEPLVLTGGETMPRVELWMRENSAAGDQSVTVSVAQVRGTKGLTSRFVEFSFEERTILIPGTCPHEPGGKMVSEEKIALLEKINRQLCILSLENNFDGIQKTLEGMGNRYLGEPITLFEAYPYIRCGGRVALNLDLFRYSAQSSNGLKLFMNDLFAYFFDKDNQPCGHVSFRKIMACKVDDGSGCMNFSEFIENKRQKRLGGTSEEKAYGDFHWYLRRKINQVGEPIHDLNFCTLGNEPGYAQCYGGG